MFQEKSPITSRAAAPSARFRTLKSSLTPASQDRVLDHVHDTPAQLGRRLLFRGREREQAGHVAQLVYLGLSLGMRGEVLLELAALLFRQRPEDVGVFEFVEALVIHSVHLGTATSGESK
jgi:hypothetical protein